VNVSPMNKSLSALAVAAGLSVGLMGGAQAQTITGVNSAGASQYTVEVTPTVSGSTDAYTYDYLTTLTSDAGGSGVNSFTFNFGADVPVTYVSNTGGYNEASVTPGAFAFGSSTGLQTVGQSATFTFSSPRPPTGTVAVGSTSPARAGGGTSALGPGPVPAAVPEPASLALLGLGMLPLGMVARRRMTKRN